MMAMPTKGFLSNKERLDRNKYSMEKAIKSMGVVL